MSQQPKWKFVANLGDVDPFESGGYFIFVDETGLYPPEAELLEVDWVSNSKCHRRVYRFILENCTYQNGILSDNQFHPNKPAWFAHPPSKENSTCFLSYLTSFSGMSLKELVALFCSDDPCKRAIAWRIVGDYHGYENLDSYPIKLTAKEMRERYNNHPYVKGSILK